MATQEQRDAFVDALIEVRRLEKERNEMLGVLIDLQGELKELTEQEDKEAETG